MPNNLQEWLALAIVVVVAAVALWRFLKKRKAKACEDCAANACAIKSNVPTDDDVRVLAKPEVTFTKRSSSTHP